MILKIFWASMSIYVSAMLWLELFGQEFYFGYQRLDVEFFLTAVVGVVGVFVLS